MDSYSVRGNILVGKIIRQKSAKTAVIERELSKYVPKYERYSKRKVKMAVHVPENIKVNVGDTVKIGETKKISKTKNFVVISVLKKSE